MTEKLIETKTEMNFKTEISLVINKLCYSSSAWWGFTTAADRQRLNAFIRRCKRQGYCATDLELEHLIAEADETFSENSQKPKPCPCSPPPRHSQHKIPI